VIGGTDHKERAMSSYEQRMQDTYAAAVGVGWAAYAGLLLLATGAFNVIGGIALLAKNSHLASGLFWGRPFWGVVYLVLGGVTLYAGFGVLARMPGARVIGIFVTLTGGFVDLLWAAGSFAANQTWVLVGLAVGLLILYGLVVRGEGATAAPPPAPPPA
jgi:hypothetical protein